MRVFSNLSDAAVWQFCFRGAWQSPLLCWKHCTDRLGALMCIFSPKPKGSPQPGKAVFEQWLIALNTPKCLTEIPEAAAWLSSVMGGRRAQVQPAPWGPEPRKKLGKG